MSRGRRRATDASLPGSGRRPKAGRRTKVGGRPTAGGHPSIGGDTAARGRPAAGGQGRRRRTRLGRLGTRIVALSVVSVLATAAVIGLLVHQMVGVIEDGRLRDRAAQTLVGAGDLFAEVGVLQRGAALDAKELPAELREQASRGVVTLRTASDGVTSVLAAGPVTVDGKPRVLSVAVEVPAAESSQAAVDRVLVAAAAGTGLVLAVVAGIVATGLTRRLETASAASLALGVGTDGRGPDGDGDAVGVTDAIGGRRKRPDEVDQLAEAIDAMADKLRARLEAEQRFTADLAHELRTPLAGLLMASELLDDDTRPAQLVRDRAERLRVLVEDLLEVSRLEAGSVPVDAQPVDLDQAVAAAVRRAAAEGVPGADAGRWESEAPGGMVVLEQRRLDRVISNLLKNAAAHGRAPVTIRISRAQLSFTDSGEGFPEAILDTGPARFVSRGGGWGLGLTIARAQAEVQDIGFTLSNAPDAGARVTLAFPVPYRQVATPATGSLPVLD